MKFVIDRIEGDFAIIERVNETGEINTFDLPLALLGSEAKEGYTVEITTYQNQKLETEIKELMNKVWED